VGDRDAGAAQGVRLLPARMLMGYRPSAPAEASAEEIETAYEQLTRELRRPRIRHGQGRGSSPTNRR
jgi:hypothetical protein